jgi:hypothetical protein
MRTPAAVFVLAALALADDRWIEYRSGPFHLVSNAGDRAARERLTELAQFRHVFGAVISQPDPGFLWPVWIVQFKTAAQQAAYALPQPWVEGRAAILASEVAGAAGEESLAALGRLLLESNLHRLPPEYENGIVALYSTLAVSASRVTLGAPPRERTLDWARAHLLATAPEFAGRLRIFVGNLAQNAEAAVAARNAFERPLAEIERRAAAHLAAGAPGTASLSGLTLNPARDFVELPVSATQIALLLADLQLANPQNLAAARKAYAALRGAGADEGLGLVALAESNAAEARRLLAAATVTGDSKSARAWVEYGSLLDDPAARFAAFEKAARLNPRWSEPWIRIAHHEPGPQRRAAALAAAAAREPRNAALWRAAAEAQEKANQFNDAARSWGAALRAAADAAERERILQARRDLEQQKADFLAAEKRRQKEEEERELQRLKDAALAEVRAAEQAANQRLSGNAPRDPNAKVEAWWDDAKGDRTVEGVIERVDCLAGSLRLTVKDARGARLLLLIRDPKKTTFKGAGDLTLACGPQRTPRPAALHVVSRQDPKFGTAADVLTIELR